MRINEDEHITIWLAGNTGLRNPMRIQEGFAAFAESSFIGNLHGTENERNFMRFLNDKGVIQNREGKDLSGSHARKWRLMFERYGFIYGQAKKKDGFVQKDLGKLDEITPFGHIFLQADTIPAMQECFLRSLGVEQYWLPDRTAHFSPFRWILAIMLELEKRTGSSELSRLEFGLWGHTTNPSYDLNDVVDHILDLRERRKKASAKRTFDKNEINERGKKYSRKKENFLDYCDMNMRYLRISGILQRKGRGLEIRPEKHYIAEKMAKCSASSLPMLEEFRLLTTGAPIPTDDETVARAVLDDLASLMQKRHILFDISDLPLTTAAEINLARYRLESILAQTDEINYAARQKEKWQEISDYMTLLIRGGGKKEYDDDYIIEVPKDETSAYLEWVMWRAVLAIDHLTNKPYEIRGFRLDSDFLPVSTAGGGRGDLYCEFENFMILTEVTMSSSSRQEAMEGEPVRRHVFDASNRYQKPVYGIFIAVKIDTNTAETFRHGVWYGKGDRKQRLKIVPFSLEQFQKYFVWMFQTGHTSPESLLNLIETCAAGRDNYEAPEWKWYIGDVVERLLAYETLTETKKTKEIKEKSYLRGLRFGSMVFNTVTGERGCVVGGKDEYILVAFEEPVIPRVQSVRQEFFDTGIYTVL